MHELFPDEELRGLLPQAFDIEGVARTEMDQPTDDLRRAVHRIRAHSERSAFDHLRRAGRTLRRHLEGRFPALLLPLFGHSLDHLWDHVTGTLHAHAIAFSNIFARKILAVV